MEKKIKTSTTTERDPVPGGRRLSGLEPTLHSRPHRRQHLQRQRLGISRTEASQNFESGKKCARYTSGRRLGAAPAAGGPRPGTNLIKLLRP